MSSDHDTGRLTIDKFTGENFHLWKFKMQAMLKAKSLKEEKAMAALVLSLGDEQLMHVQNAATAAEVWRKLKVVVHERKGIANKLYLRCKFLTVVMKDGDGMLEHINKVKMMAQKLEAIGAQVDNEDIITTLLYSLPESFESLNVSLESRADDLTLEFLTARLLLEETHRSDGQDSGGKDGRAFYGRSRISNTTMKKAGGPCFYCGKEGHFKKECRKRHMTSKRAWLNNLQPLNNARVHLAGNRTVEATEKGTATIQTALPNGKMTTCTFKDVWLVPKLERSLLSVAQLEGAGANIQFVGGRCKSGPVRVRLLSVATVRRVFMPWDNLWMLLPIAMLLPSAQLQQLWRPGIDAWGISRPAHGQEGPDKATKLPFPKERSSRASEVLELVHSDVCGPMRTLTIGGACYFILFIDDKSRAVFPCLLKTKAETLPSFKTFAAAAATETRCLLKVLQYDHGGEYLSKPF
ncbi:hypothetical protein PhCBS80983_g03710 [Powellomyces hirtus]|uniref:CCHC-type domain-containing protein n=1 Tax=Powellomyces hirtus TaxID=109895 RepID=A0A507E1L7_9FUNG|nr:hypothetical protein PhCBS80983_g03710 [Powellomyces hirtus]